MSEPEPNLDALGLLGGRLRYSVRFGSVDASAGLVHANTTSAMNELPDATLTLDPALVEPIDYFADLEMSAVSGDTVIPRFTGSVRTANPSEEGIVITAMGAVTLTEHTTGALVSRVPPGELFHLITRTSGIREEKINVQGLDALPLELFEIVVPIDGLDVPLPTEFAGVHFVSAARGLRALGGLEVTDEFRSQFEAPAFALTFATARRTFEAEQAGLAAVDLALAWLTTRLRYGLSELPNGTALLFDRTQSLARLSSRRLVAVRGLTTQRRWVRTTEGTELDRTVTLTPSARVNPELPHLTLQERQAILAVKRATVEPDPLARVHALWEAIEFYCSGAKIEASFTRSELAAIRNALPSELNPKQRQRAGELIGIFNEPSLMMRLLVALDEDGVPIDRSELALLRDLRQLRNDVVHGRQSALPAIEDVEYATSIVARMLVFRVAQRAAVI